MKISCVANEHKLRILTFSLIIGAGVIAFISLDIYAELPSLFVSPKLAREALFLPWFSLAFCFLALIAISVARTSDRAGDPSDAELGSLQKESSRSRAELLIDQ